MCFSIARRQKSVNPTPAALLPSLCSSQGAHCPFPPYIPQVARTDTAPECDCILPSSMGAKQLRQPGDAQAQPLSKAPAHRARVSQRLPLGWQHSHLPQAGTAPRGPPTAQCGSEGGLTSHS